MTIRTACSSSLISLNEACLAIAKGDCTSAIVGGTNIIMGHGMTVSLSELGALAPDGSCKTFSSEANGYARAEGIAAVYVKPLSSALRDGNPIRAIITGTATNSNGKSQSISRPSASAQEALIRHTYQIAGISEEDVSKTAFCEFHGTGTPVGDRLEAEAVVRVFGPLGGVHIGSTKPNLGHSEGAAGITSLIKAVLALEHRTIPPSIKFMPLNPRIPFEEGKLTLSKEASPWPEGRADRISINSFGIGGSNAHAIIESAANIGLSQAHSRETSSNTPQLLIYSAKTHNSLGEMIQRYQTIVTSDSFPLADVAYTLANRREHFPYRAFSVHAQDKICIPAVLPVWKSGQRPSLVMVFNGQGAQWPRMGKELHRCNAMFNSTIKLLENQLRSLGASWSLEEELLKPTRTSRINHAEYSQPLCTAIQIALVDTFSSIRIRPVAVVGHSSGEIAAAYAAGGLTADEAMSVAFHRGAATKLQKKAGAMAAIGTGWEEVERHLVPGVVLACDNSHKGVTISGDAEKLEDVIANIKRSYPDILTSKLKVSHAYHSHHMAEIGEEYFQSMVTSKVVGEKPRIPFFSTVKGELLTTDRLGPKYWQDNLEQPVRFKSAVYDLLDSSGFNHPVFLEIGPHPSLAGSLRQNLTHASRNTLALVSTFSKQQDSSETFLAAVGKLYTFHLGVDFKALMPAESHACAPGLPPYPWDRQRIHRTESRVSKELRYNSVPYHNLLGRRVHESTDFEPIWRNLLHLENVPWVRDHMIDNDIVFPFSGYISMAAEAMQQTSNTRLNNVQFRETAVEAALLLSESEPTELVTTFRRQRPTERIESEWWNFSISSHNGTVWTKHCSGAVRTYRENTSKKPGRMESLPRIVSIQKWYKALDRRGLNYGFHFKVLEHATSSTIAPRMAKSRVRNNWHGDEEDYYLHPVIVDSMFQTLSVAAQHGLTHAYRKLIATSIESLTISRCSSDHFTVSTSAELLRDGVLGAGSCTSGSQIVMEVSGARLTILDNNEHRSISTMPILARSEFVSHIDFVDVKSLAEGLQDWDKYGGLLDELASLSMSRYRQVATGIVDDKIPHLQMYKAWLNQQPPSNINTATPNSSIISLVNQLADTPAAYLAAAILKMCESAQEILLGEKTTSDILSEVDNLNKVKSFGVTSWSSNMCSKFIQALALSTPCLRVLELGAGYGTSTGGYLDTLTHPNGQHLYSQYVCADTSMGMLNVIKEKFMTAKNLETTLLDVNKNLSTQSLDDDDKKFDLIIASSILHKTSRLHESFVNLHKLLSANGRLLIKEPCSSFYWRKYVLGVLPEWMNDGQNGKGKEELCLSPRQWTETLVAAGFETPEIVVQGDSDVVVITRRAKDEEITDLKKVRLLCSEHSAPDTLLTKELEARGYEITRCTLSTLPPDGQDIISVLDLDEKSFFEDIEEPVFENFKDFIMNVQSSGASIFWVTRLCQISPANPKFAPIIGLSRTLRVEKSLDFAVCETDDFHSTSGCATIVDVFDAFQRRESEKDGPGVDFEFAISKNNILVPRIFPFSQEDELQSNRKFDQGYLEVKNLGTLDKMHWIGQQSSAAPRAAEVEADVYAIGIDFKVLSLFVDILI
jgi:acyl transferase domain-containing protein